MGAVHEEYDRYLQWMRTADIADDARRIAKIVRANLDALIPTVSNGGQRATNLTPMIRQGLSVTTDFIEEAPAHGVAAALPWNRLKKLIVGPFRGFRREEHFDLSHNVVLFQGPNGSGKSSLCEALEYALLGEVEEAVAKRIDDLNTYFNNIHEGRFVPPQLLSAGAGEGVRIAPNAELLRFSIIEKNRIESFARLAARTPAQASALLAALFGLDGFNNFVGNFTGTLDSQLRLTTPKQDLLTLKRVALEAARQTVADNVAVQAAFDLEQEAIASDFRAEMTYTKLLEHLGMEGRDGRLQEIIAALQEQVPARSEVTAAALKALRRSLRTKRQQLHECEAQLAARAGQVSFLALYRAVHALADDHPGACPACDTPLAVVVRNPFVRAQEGLELLQDLATLEAMKVRLEVECAQLSVQLKNKVAAAHAYTAFTDGALSPLIAWVEEEQPRDAWVEGLLTKITWKTLLKEARKLERIDVGIRERQDRRAALAEEARLLERVKDSVNEFRVRRTLHEEQVAAERLKIDGFEVANAQLIEEVANEALARDLEIRIQAGYERFLESIKRCRDALPAGLLADLNETTRDLYNRFNADDHVNDLIDTLTLPMRGGERVQVTFNGRPAQTHDALSVLSEGHLRCLGLAILLAKNIKLGLPLLIFDDAVNAIDHDHRKGIRDTLFGDARLQGKQIIVTCHSPEFITQVQNGLGQAVSKLYILKHHTGDHQPAIGNGTDRHYLRRAIERLDNGDQRQALASSRQALENLTARVWKSMVNADDALARISLVLRGPASEPELRNLIGELFKAVNKGVEQGRLAGDAWVRRQEAFRELLAVPEATLAWRYLNKGTHDGDGEDFEIGVVQQIVAALRKLSDSFAQ